MNRLLHTDAALATEELETDLLLEALYQRFGFDFRAYERAALKSKLHALMQARQLATVSQLQDRMLHDPQTGAALLRALSVQPSSAVRRPAAGTPAAQGARLLPARLGRAQGVAGRMRGRAGSMDARDPAGRRTAARAHRDICHRRQRRNAGRRRRRQHRPRLPGRVSGKLPQERRQRQPGRFLRRQGKRAVLQPQLRSRITWAQYNLVTDASFNEFQLILCRKALADFGPVLRQHTLQLFHDSLSLFGVLGLDREMDDGDLLRGSYQHVFPASPGTNASPETFHNRGQTSILKYFQIRGQTSIVK
ncbi:chemotaxis protein [Massilia sp. B-10]|nr:chemotaxis protein [Massilia sp. B-10]